MPLRSAVSTLAAAPAVAATPAADPAPAVTAEQFFGRDVSAELSRSPGTKTPGAELKAPAPKPARKPRAASKVPATTQPTAGSDVKAVRALLTAVELDMLDVKGKMNKALEKFQPRLGRLRARHAELSEELTKALTR